VSGIRKSAVPTSATAHALAGLRSAAACSGVQAPAWDRRPSTWKTFHHAAPDGWNHEVVVAPTGTGILKMTGPDGWSTLLLTHAIDDRGRAMIRTMQGENPLSDIPSLLGMEVSEEDRREDLRNIMLAALADVMDMDPGSDHAMVATSWNPGARVSASRSDASRPWPEPTGRLLEALDGVGPVHRLVPGRLLPAVRGMLTDDAGGTWPDDDGLTLSSETAIEADLQDPLAVLRTMAACDAARRITSSPPGTLMRPGISGSHGR
jgi:hypothetical protein